jgi:cephalosporin hydroxylase
MCDYYTLVRKVQPHVVVETGVCHGVSSLFVLLVLRENGSGQLHSIDFPFRTDDSLEQVRKKTFSGYGGAAIPADKDPGWILSDAVQSRWELTIGKSQRELPKLLPQLPGLDLFIHDSEHSHPCMMFEFELAYEWLDEGGIVLSDDISWNEAFQTFTDVRAPKRHELIFTNVGYFVKE